MSVQERIRALLASSIGIELPLGTNLALDAFVRERCEALGLSAPEEYATAIGGPGSSEFQRLVNAVTVKYTWFFRDLPQIQAIRELLASRAQSLDVWVPGCASGEDAYTIALVARECGADVRVLATDVSSEAIERARRGRYGAWSTRDVPPELHRYFEHTRAGHLSPTSELRAKVHFEIHNLLAPPPVPPNGRGWDVILCRNVLMYFSQEKAQATAGILARALCEDGHLLLGASDVLIEPPPDARVEYVAGRVALRRRPNRERWGSPLRELPEPAPPPRAKAPVPVHVLPVVAAPPAEAQSLLGAAHVYLSAGKLELALRGYVSACEAEPVSTEPRLYAGIAHYLLGDLPQALGALRAALLLDHRCWPASYYLGLCYESMGHARDAEREYERAARQSEREQATDDDPSSPLFGFRRDLAWLAKQRCRSRPLVSP